MRSGGLWSQPNPVPSWEWRKAKGEALPGELAGKFLGNRRSRMHPKPGCPSAASISPGHRLPFNSAEDAERTGYRAARDVMLGRAAAARAPASLLPT